MINVINLHKTFFQSRRSESSIIDEDDEDELEDMKNESNLIEGTSRGVVKGSILLKYLRVGSSVFYAFFVFMLFLITQLVVSLNDYFVNVLYVYHNRLLILILRY